MSVTEIELKQKVAASYKKTIVGKFKTLGSEIWKYRLSYLFLLPFMITFLIFIIIPVLVSVVLSFTYYNAIQPPQFIGWRHFQYLLSQDIIFLKHALPNTIKFAVIVGPGGYLCAFFLAWLIAQIKDRFRIWFALMFFAPSLATGIALSIIWIPLLSGSRIGYLNSFLLKFGFIDQPQLWTQDPDYLMNSMMVVTLWTSMGVGFLALLAGILNVDKTLHEAGRIDGIRNALQEVWYITIPAMKPQMLFAAVMAIVGAFKMGHIGVELSGRNPTPEYAGNLLVNHVEDFGLIRFEMGYASAVAVVLVIIILMFNRLSWKLFGTKED